MYQLSSFEQFALRLLNLQAHYYDDCKDNEWASYDEIRPWF